MAGRIMDNHYDLSSRKQWLCIYCLTWMFCHFWQKEKNKSAPIFQRSESVMNDLCQGLMRRLTWIRHLSECHDLIQQNPKRPNVRLNRELVLMDGLWSSPLHREFSSFFGFIYILVLFLQTKQETPCILVSFGVKECTISPLFFLLWQVKNVLCSQCLPSFFH